MGEVWATPFPLLAEEAGDGLMLKAAADGLGKEGGGGVLDDLGDLLLLG